MMKVFFALLLCTLVYGEGVKNVRQKFEDKANTALKGQITKELQASYLYQAYSQYFSRADVALEGFAKFFSDASKEERTHAEKLMEYLNKRGGEVGLSDVKLKDICKIVSDGLADISFGFSKDTACICYFMAEEATSTEKCIRDHWFNGLMAFEDTLVLERYVNSEILDIHEKNSNDPHLLDYLESDFLTEQVDAIKDISDKITQLKRAGKGVGEYLFDQKLK